MSGPTMTIQVAIDCADPHAQARFWADAFGFEVEDHHELVLAMLELGHAQETDTIEIGGRKAWATAAACRHPAGAMPRLLFQQVPEPKGSKNRVHLDLHVNADELEATTARAIAAGATQLWVGQQGPQTWTTYADPEGNEFCISAAAPARS